MGAWLSLADAWRLSVAWYHDRLDPAFRGRTPEGAVAIFRSVGLDGPFWSLGDATPLPQDHA